MNDRRDRPSGEPLKAADIRKVVADLKKAGDNDPCGTFNRPHLVAADGLCVACERRPEHLEFVRYLDAQDP